MPWDTWGTVRIHRDKCRPRETGRDQTQELVETGRDKYIPTETIVKSRRPGGLAETITEVSVDAERLTRDHYTLRDT